MEWIYSVFIEHSALQAVIILSFICAIGLALGKIKVLGISLGVTFVFFMGIFAGHLGITIDPQMLNYAESFGLILFVYALGLQVGPGFFSAFRNGGMKLNMLALSLIVLDMIFTVVPTYFTSISLPDMVGIMCGAATNTPTLAAAQQALKQLGLPSSSPALGCAISYPLGVIGVILAIIVMRKVLMRNRNINEDIKDDSDSTFVAAFNVHNPAIFNRNLRDVAKLSGHQFVISRLWRNGEVSIPTSNSILCENDRVLVVTSEKDCEALTLLFGQKEDTDWNKAGIDWNAIDSQLISQRILITRSEINGKKLGSLHLRNDFGVNTTRIYRSGMRLLATPDLRLQIGDRITVVGEAKAIKNVENLVGNAVKSLSEPNLVSVFIGMTLGLILGAIPISLPGISMPVKLGLAGGPIIVGILIGTFGPRLHMITYVTRSANLMLRAIGLSLYLACLGLDSGAHFFETIIRPEGLLWVLMGFIITVVPVLIIGTIALKLMKIDFATTSGMLCGSMANPMALNYSNDSLHSDVPSVAYATVYPMSMFARVIFAQIILMALCG